MYNAWWPTSRLPNSLVMPYIGAIMWLSSGSLRSQCRLLRAGRARSYIHSGRVKWGSPFVPCMINYVGRNEHAVRGPHSHTTLRPSNFTWCCWSGTMVFRSFLQDTQLSKRTHTLRTCQVLTRRFSKAIVASLRTRGVQPGMGLGGKYISSGERKA